MRGSDLHCKWLFQCPHLTLWHCVDELFGEKGCFGFSRANVRFIEVWSASILLLLLLCSANFPLKSQALPQSRCCSKLVYFVTLCFDVTGVGMRKAMITGTTITCQSLMATFLGKKCVLISFFLYILIKRASLMFAQSGFCSARQSSEKRRVGENLCRFLWRRCVDLLIHPYCVTSLAVS